MGPLLAPSPRRLTRTPPHPIFRHRSTNLQQPRQPLHSINGNINSKRNRKRRRTLRTSAFCALHPYRPLSNLKTTCRRARATQSPARTAAGASKRDCLRPTWPSAGSTAGRALCATARCRPERTLHTSIAAKAAATRAHKVQLPLLLLLPLKAEGAVCRSACTTAPPTKSPRSSSPPAFSTPRIRACWAKVCTSLRTSTRLCGTAPL